VKNFKPDLRNQAYEKLEALKQQMTIQEVLKNKKRNRIQIELASSKLVLPFKKNNDISSECWIVNMGNLYIRNDKKPEHLTDL